MSTAPPPATQNGDSAPILPAANLPVPQLESLKFKANQIIESINVLQHTLNAYPGWMYAWPDILSKYNVLLSQTHNFSTALLQPFPASTTSSSSLRAPAQPAGNIYERIALHPRSGMTDTQLDTEVTPLLRNQQTTDVLRQENDTVRRLSEHMSTRGSLGVLGLSNPPAPAGGFSIPKKPEYEDVLAECNEIRDAHDRRVDRAVRAVAMLREKFDWKQRVEVEVEEPEELDWDPRFGRKPDPAPMDAVMDDESIGSEDGDDEEGNSDEEDADDIEGALVNAEATSPSAGDMTEGFGVTAAVTNVEPIDVDAIDLS
ncbi:hypothetical protein CVT24_000988 [Panaeolus cyanescens]|uniref:Mediator of RNA polymerase II transcription subunit 8 n=1 Tax=Panaeolus cyanescens TaxID=181874 RepID=A0A409YCG5_9AGAR|nr:hypothetical protein CVT24_000988 [Panaeolus cyanescens]